LIRWRKGTRQSGLRLRKCLVGQVWAGLEGVLIVVKLETSGRGGCYGSSDSSGSDSLPSATTCSDLNFLDEYGLVVVRTQTKIS
jgi:hypothetical protein